MATTQQNEQKGPKSLIFGRFDEGIQMKAF